MNSIIVIPARLQSSRLPRKLLLCETGKPLIQHTYEAATRSVRAQKIMVAADSEEIAEVVRGFGGNVVLTYPGAASGTDRIAEAVRDLVDYDVVVNVQGDEPMIPAEIIDLLIEIMADTTAEIATLAAPLVDQSRIRDPACVKVVVDDNGHALYFSRAPIPYLRDQSAKYPPSYWQHIGIYAYRRDALLKMAALPPGQLEQAEQLEQLRALAAGMTIAIGKVDTPTIGVDTAEDYHRFCSVYKETRS